jgi:thioredoxin 1
MASEKVKIITKGNLKSEVLDASIPVMVDFWAPWCGPCRMVGPVMDELATLLEGKVVISKLNVDEEGEIAAQYKIMSIPTVMIFKNGVSVERMVGAKSKEEYITILNSHS